MLWRILSELPQPYRETMVLYYRQEQSTAAIAWRRRQRKERFANDSARTWNVARAGGADAGIESYSFLAGVRICDGGDAGVARPAPQGEGGDGWSGAKGSAAIGGGALIAWVAFLSGPVLGLLIGGHATWRRDAIGEIREGAAVDRTLHVFHRGVFRGPLLRLYCARQFLARLFAISSQA